MPRRGKKLLALDYGRRRIGVASCDATGTATEAVGFVPRADDASAAAVIARLAAEQGAQGIVVGLPLHASGATGDNVRYLRHFLRALRAVCTLPIHEVDERHSSSEAELLLRQEGRWPASPGQLDAKAAVVILRRYLAGE